MHTDKSSNVKSLGNVQKHTGMASVNKLLGRSADVEYIEEWAQLLAQTINGPKELHEVSVVIFRIGNDWLGLSTDVFVEVAETRHIHRIPHCNNPVILGLANLNGQLKICFSLDRLLEIEFEMEEDSLGKVKRLIVIKKEEEFWIFPANEVYGIHYCESIQIENVPINISKSASNFLKGVLHWNERTVGYLDEDVLFYRLKKEMEKQKYLG